MHYAARTVVKDKLDKWEKMKYKKNCNISYTEVMHNTIITAEFT
jgi:hypothetical protein